MKNNKAFAVFTACVLIFMCVVLSLAGCGKGVDEEYQYNTQIEINENKPVEGEADVTAITGYVEDTEQKFLELPYSVKDTDIEIVSIGKYSGVYSENGTNDEVKDVLALVVRNKSAKVISYSNFTMKYDTDKECSFSPTNLPGNQSSLVFTGAEPVAYKDVKKLEYVDSMAVMSEKLPLLEGVVGVDYKDGKFVVTNLTGDDLGDVYIRFKNSTDGNAYLGGITYSVLVPDVKAYETYVVDAEDYDEATSVILAVENITE